jgi:protein SCO1
MKLFALNTILLLLILALKLSGCQENNLPLMSENQLAAGQLSGSPVIQTGYGAIPPFKFLNQDSLWVSNETFAGKIYVAEFFFTSCPTICPRMKTQLLRVYNAFKNNPEVLFLSHTLNPAHDSVPVLRAYAQRLGIAGNKWHVVTGNRERIYNMAQNHYLITASQNSLADKSVIHSSAFILVDQQGTIKDLYNGTNEKDVDRMIHDLTQLGYFEELFYKN